MWPDPVPSLDDDELTESYAVDDRSRPWLRVNFVSSLDGAATKDGLSGGLSTEPDKRGFALLRRLCDVVVVGAGTVRAEGYGAMRLDAAQLSWRRDHGITEQPVFAIVTSRLDLDPASTVFTEAPVRPIVITSESAPSDRRQALARVAEVVSCGDTAVEPSLLVEALAQRGLMQLHCEGGPHLFGSMIASGAVDELCLTLSPSLVGGTGPRISANTASVIPETMELAQVLESGGTLLLRYVRG